MTEAVSTSKTPVNFYQTTWHNILQEGTLQMLNIFGGNKKAT